MLALNAPTRIISAIKRVVKKGCWGADLLIIISIFQGGSAFDLGRMRCLAGRSILAGLFQHVDDLLLELLDAAFV